jgi:hypothetical protein
LYSVVLGRELRLKITASVLRTIERKGGIDAYLLLTRRAKLDEGLALSLRQQMRDALRKKLMLPSRELTRERIAVELDKLNYLAHPPGVAPAPVLQRKKPKLPKMKSEVEVALRRGKLNIDTLLREEDELRKATGKAVESAFGVATEQLDVAQHP